MDALPVLPTPPEAAGRAVLPARRATTGGLAAPRWTALAAALLIAVAAMGVASVRVVRVSHASVWGAIGTTIVSEQGSSDALAGTDLAAGDTISVGSTGVATLRFDGGEARLGPGSSIRIDDLDAAGIVLTQLAGRVYHRVAVASDRAYVVATASMTWTSHGGAFEIDRVPVDGGPGEHVTVTAVQDAVDFGGGDLDGSLVEGRQLTVLFGGITPNVLSGDVQAPWLADPWVAANGERDRADGYPPGILEPTAGLPGVDEAVTRP